MHLLIDLQACQTSSSRNRGIGRYSLALAKAMACAPGEHRVSILLSDRFPETIPPLRRIFDPLIGRDNIHVLALPPGCRDTEPTNIGRVRIAELLRQKFIEDLKPDAVHVSSLFEGFSDDATIAIEPFSRRRPLNVVTLYDLIPFLNQAAYLSDPYIRRWYMRRLQHLRNADLLLAISESSRQEALTVLNISPERVINISSAIDDHFMPLTLEESRADKIRRSYGLHERFVMYTGGVDYRKNIEGLIEAYAQLTPTLRECHQLVIVCKIRDGDRSRLEALGKRYGLAPGQLAFTGFVSEEDLVALYNMAHLFVFPSLHEGFGLPVLEAMACGTPAIAANRSSIPEVVGNNEALFDPEDSQQMVEALSRGLTDNNFRGRLRVHGLRQAKSFSWQASARAAFLAIESQIGDNSVDDLSSAESQVSGRLKLAYLSPLPPQRSGIADYSARLLPELAKYYDIDIISDEAHVNDDLAAYFTVRSSEWFLMHSKHYSRVLYHMGNSHFHIPMMSLLSSVPGVVFLHDFYLSGMLNHAQAFGLDDTAFSLSMVRSHGYRALDLLVKSGVDGAARTYPANRWVMDGAIGVLVHSQFAIDQCDYHYGDAYQGRLARIPFSCQVAKQSDREDARDRLGFGADEFVVCCFGFLAASKLNLELINAWLGTDLGAAKNARLVFVGDHTSHEYGQKIDALVKTSNNISITGYVTASTYNDWLSAADVGVQLRNQTRGETSAALFDCLGHGLPLIYNNHGTASELPDQIGLALDDQPSIHSLKQALMLLWKDVDLRDKLGDSGQQYVLRNHNPALVARSYFEAIENHYASSPLAAELTHVNRLSDSIEAEPFSPWSSQELYDVSRAVALNRHALFPPRLLLDITGGDSTHLALVLPVLLEMLPSPWQLECVQESGDGWITARNAMAGMFEVPDEYVVPHRNDCWLSVSCESRFLSHDAPALYVSKSGWMDIACVDSESLKGLIDWLQGEVAPPWVQPMENVASS